MIPTGALVEETVRKLDMTKHLNAYPKKRFVEWELRGEPGDDVPPANAVNDDLPAPMRYMLENKRVRITEKPFICDTCWKGFDTERELGVHVKLHERKSSAKVKKKVHSKHYEYEKILKLLEKNT